MTLIQFSNSAGTYFLDRNGGREKSEGKGEIVCMQHKLPHQLERNAAGHIFHHATC